MGLLNLFQWQGSGKVYSLPWLKNRLEYCSDPKRILSYAKTSFTRSRFVMTMLTEFHLSRNSIMVSEDSHAIWLKRMAIPHMPKDEAIPQIARKVMEGLFPLPDPGKAEQSFNISDRLIRELYYIMLDDVLKVTVLKPLEDYVSHTKFTHGSRPMVLEGLMYSFRLHLPFLRPIRFILDRLFFKETLYTKRVATKLEKMVCDFTIPKPVRGSQHSQS